MSHRIASVCLLASALALGAPSRADDATEAAPVSGAKLDVIVVDDPKCKDDPLDDNKRCKAGLLGLPARATPFLLFSLVTLTTATVQTASGGSGGAQPVPVPPSH